MAIVKRNIFAIFVHYSWKVFKIVIEKYVIDYVVVSLIGILWRKFVYFFFYSHIVVTNISPLYASICIEKFLFPFYSLIRLRSMSLRK